MSHKLTHEEFLSRISSNVLDNYKILNKYKTSVDPILLKDKLGIIYSKKPFDLFTNKKINIRSAVDKTKAMIKIIENIHGENVYKVKGVYSKGRHPIIVTDYLGIAYNTTFTDLKVGKAPSIISAVNKNEAFTKLANNIHNNKYYYNKSIYKKNRDKVIITCKIHGDFKQTPQAHLQGQGCPKCGLIQTGISNSKSEQQFIYECNKIHNYKYNYNNLNYTYSGNKIIVICKEHGAFYPTANNHLRGSGCPECAKEGNGASGYNKNNWVSFFNKATGKKQPTVYIIKCSSKNKEEEFIKIGRTFRTLKHRFGKTPNTYLPYSYKELAIIKGDVEFIFDLEKKLHKDFKKFKYVPKSRFSGETECFSTNIITELKNIKYEES